MYELLTDLESTTDFSKDILHGNRGVLKMDFAGCYKLTSIQCRLIKSYYHGYRTHVEDGEELEC
jgi:hypothetical protein